MHTVGSRLDGLNAILTARRSGRPGPDARRRCARPERHLTIIVVELILLGAGISIITGHQVLASRVLGLLALLGGLLVLAAVTSYLLRPTTPRPPEPILRDGLRKLRRRLHP